MHILFWLAMFGSWYYFNTISFNPARETPAAWLLALHNTAVLALAYYSLMYLIWPRLIAKKRWWATLPAMVIWVFLLAAFISLGDVLVFHQCRSCAQRLAQYSPDYYAFLQRDFPDIVFVRVLSGGLLYQLVFQLSLPVAIKIGRSYFRQTVQQLQLAKDNLQLEFNFLKSQVNPHFLFNTLNNIYSLVVAQRNEQAAATLARLSGFMRYALYETGDEKIALQKEAQLLKDYVELEKLRLNESDVQFRFETDSSDYTLPPLLLMPALENAFKYTADKKESRIQVSINAARGILNVSIENNFDPQRINDAGGIGLQNLQRRVQHYYGSGATYSACAANDVYLFRLSCPLT
jgi:sensor histidine kinase YesM